MNIHYPNTEMQSETHTSSQSSSDGVNNEMAFPMGEIHTMEERDCSEKRRNSQILDGGLNKLDKSAYACSKRRFSGINILRQKLKSTLTLSSSKGELTEHTLPGSTDRKSSTFFNKRKHMKRLRTETILQG